MCRGRGDLCSESRSRRTCSAHAVLIPERLVLVPSETHLRGPMGTPRQHTVDVSGTRTHVWEYGEARASRTILAIHGFRGDHHGLEPIAQRLNDYRVLVPDLPGFGESARFTHTQHDVGAYAEWLAELVRVLGVGPDVVLVGHSFGSILSAAAVSRGLECADLILINPIGAPALTGPRRILTKLAVGYYAAASRLPQSIGLALLRNPAIVRMMSAAMARTRDRALRSWIHDQHDRYFSAFSDREVVLESFRASVSHDVGEYAPTLRTRTTLIASDHDDITTITEQYALAKRFTPPARVRVVPGVGHLIHYEAPRTAARYIVEALGESE